MLSHLHIIINALGIVHIKDEHVLHSKHFTLVKVSERVATRLHLPQTRLVWSLLHLLFRFRLGLSQARAIPHTLFTYHE